MKSIPPSIFLVRKYRNQLAIGFVLAMLLLWFPRGHSSSETVLLTGGLGFIGSNLVDELLVEGYNVVIFDDESSGHNYNPKATTIIGDITNTEQLDTIKIKVDYIVHFAAAISVSESMKDPEKYKRINHGGSKNVLDWAVKNGVRKIVGASSAAVYGTPKQVPLDETAPLSPISPYADTKLSMEYLFEEYHYKHGITAICLRFFNVYGPRQDPKSTYSGVISKFLDNAINGENVTIYGDGSNTRDFVFVKDVAKANVMAIRRGRGFRVYNVGTETITTITDLAKAVIQATDSKSIIQYREARAGDIKESLSNSSRIHRELGWFPHISLEQGIRRTYSWYKVEVLMES